MSTKKGIFARAARRLRKPTAGKPESVERGPLQHDDDGNIHASGISHSDEPRSGRERVATDIEHDNRVGPSEELDRASGDRESVGEI